jgi:hypothetical protein
MINIDGIDFTLLADYDAGKYRQLSFVGKTTYLHERVQKILIRPCREAMKSSVNTDLGLILTTGICAGISTAGTFLRGRRAKRPGEDRKLFEALARKYMDIARVAPRPRVGWVKWLYTDLRCGLAHAFTIQSCGIEFEAKGYAERKSYGLELNPVELLEGFARAVSKYLDDVRRAGPRYGLGAKFENRFDEIFQD